MVRLLLGLSGALIVSPTARADGGAELQKTRLALAHYDLDTHGAGTIAALAELTALLPRTELEPAKRSELRFLRAAAASDLLVLARVRGDAAIQPALEHALGAPAGSAFEQLDRELAACSDPGYRELAASLRGSLALARERGQLPLGRFRGVAGSQRDLLFVHALAQLANDLLAAPLTALGSYGVDPCAGVATCSQPHAVFDARGRMAAEALAEAGRALKRLRSAAEQGDPLAAAATSELAVLDLVVAFAAMELRPAPRLEQDGIFTDERGAALEAVPDLVLWVGDRSVRYAYVPRVRLDSQGALALFAPAEPVMPQSAELAIGSAAHPYLDPVPELVAFFRSVLAVDPDLRIAVAAAAPDASALMLGRTLTSLKRAGRDHVIVVGRGADGLQAAQSVRLSAKAEAGTTAGLPAELELRIRLGGYSLRLPSDGATAQDIPRVRDEHGLRFDTAALAARLGGRETATAQVSFMADVASRDFTAALMLVGKATRAQEIVLP